MLLPNCHKWEFLCSVFKLGKEHLSQEQASSISLEVDNVNYFWQTLKAKEFQSEMYSLNIFSNFESNSISKFYLYSQIHEATVHCSYLPKYNKIKFPPQLLPFTVPFRIQRNAEVKAHDSLPPLAKLLSIYILNQSPLHYLFCQTCFGFVGVGVFCI